MTEQGMEGIVINIVKSYKRVEVVKIHDRPRPEETGHSRRVLIYMKYPLSLGSKMRKNYPCELNKGFVSKIQQTSEKFRWYNNQTVVSITTKMSILVGITKHIRITLDEGLCRPCNSYGPNHERQVQFRQAPKIWDWSSDLITGYFFILILQSLLKCLKNRLIENMGLKATKELRTLLKKLFIKIFTYVSQ